MAWQPLLLVLNQRGVEFTNHLDVVNLGYDALHLLEQVAATGSEPPEPVSEDAPERVVVDALLDRLGRAAPGPTPDPLGLRSGLPLAELPGRLAAPAAPSASDLLSLRLPRTLALTAEGFAFFHPSGARAATVSAAELAALLLFGPTVEASEAFALHQQALGPAAIDRDHFDRLVEDAVRGSILTVVDPVAAPDVDDGRFKVRSLAEVFTQRKGLIASGNEMMRRPAAPGKVSVVALYENPIAINLALGLLLSYTAQYEGGRLLDHYELLPAWLASPKAIRRRLERSGPAVFLFSNYIWSVEQNLAIAAMIKEMSPESVCIHGGPSTPKYHDDAAAFFAANVGVDVAVRGEGEQALVEILDALGGVLAGRNGDLTVLDRVPGVSYRDGGEVRRTPDRPRMAELDVVPSPYLTGFFDEIVGRGVDFQTLETNRGCPYGCTFCDWGSATNSRIRQFDLQRVLDEIEWGARNNIEMLFLADANFGIFSRDVDIARKIVECRETYGFPRSVVCCFAKNTTKYTVEICSLLWNADISFFAAIALQSMDPQVLATVDRSNIKTEAYDRIADHLVGLGATVYTELMMGLPGSTVASFSDDLQGCIDRDIYASVYDTMLLPNSPMNAPEYRQRHRLEVDVVEVQPGVERTLVASSATFTRADRELMNLHRRTFRVFENLGLLRHVARWVRHTTGTREIDFYDRLGERAVAPGSDLPLVRWMVQDLQILVPPMSWAHFLDEVSRYLVEELGLPRSSGMDTVFMVQHTLISDLGRAFPAVVDLPHDYAAWYLELSTARRSGGRWWETTPPLESFGPATFVVSGSESINDAQWGHYLLEDLTKFYELDSPVMRGARSSAHKLLTATSGAAPA